MADKHQEDFKTFLGGPVTRCEALPVTPKAQTLPLTGLDWKPFEQLCCRLVEREPGVEGTPHLYGVPGDKQKGVDIVARQRAGGALQTWCYQCKDYDYFPPGEFEKAIAALEYEADHYVFCLAGPAQRSLRDLESKHEHVTLWDEEDISRKLKRHSDLVAEFFHPAWLEVFLGMPPDVAQAVLLVVPVIHQAGGRIPQVRNLAAQLESLEQALPHLDAAGKAAARATINKLERAIAALPDHESAYRQRIKDKYAEDAPYFVPPEVETTEVAPPAAESKTPRSARRRRQRAEYCEWIPAGQEIQRVRLKSLEQGVARYDCIILLGDPGSGKTTALENLAYHFADEPEKLPLSLRLSEFGPGMSVEDFILQGWGDRLEAGRWGSPELAANLEGYLEAGRLFLLFDALNEMPRDGYHERAQALRRFIDHWSARGNRFLVTCRVLDYGEELAGLQRVEVLPLDDDQVQRFLENELADGWQALWQALVAGEKKKRRLLEMARNPYLLTVMIDVYEKDGELDQNRAGLMQRFTQILMHREQEKHERDQWLAADVQRESLSVMAFEMQSRNGSGAAVDTDLVKTVMPEQVDTHPNWPPRLAPPDQVLTLAAGARIVEMPVDRSSVRFYHQLLQEYFAARELLKRDPAGLAGLWRWDWLEEEMELWVRPENNYDPLPPPPPTGWEETAILAAGLAAENENQLVQALVQVNPVLAGRCLHQAGAKVDRALRGTVIKALLSTIARPEVALRVRIAAGEVLGHLGDPRLGEMVVVPAGRFMMGEGKEQHKPHLPAYRLGVYPVTNDEYERFVEAGGYRERRWWTEAGWAQREEWGWHGPRYWEDTRFNNPNQPVVGVSWYECVAYCRWLSAQSGRLYRLPTEAEWEKGARGVDGRDYPWGDRFEAGRLNAREGDQQVRATTPVGIYARGESPFGAMDCAGNVWEWCATKVPSAEFKSYPYDVSEAEWSEVYLEGGEIRALRGGLWDGNRSLARCAFRDGFGPSGGLSSFGYRLVSPI